ncbi:hypothetical protein EDD11_005677 [Mortierella claussenii]|nr:hypothetical protein EDD11_005677 [Mortierella claussenii]
MSSSTSQLSPEHPLQTVRQLYLDASLIEQTIQQHVEASKVGYRPTYSPHTTSPTSERRLNLSDTSSAASLQGQSRRQSSVSSAQSQRRSSRQSHQQALQEDSGFQIPPSSHFRSRHEELGFLRDSLKDVYEVVLLEDLIAAVEKSADERLWRHVFYTPIEELRAELRKLDKNSARRQEVMDELSKLLDKGTGFYHEMITALRCEHGMDLNTVAVDILQAVSGTSKSRPSATAIDAAKPLHNNTRARNSQGRQPARVKDNGSSAGPCYSLEALANCIQKCFIYLGDLARYRTNIRLETQAMMTNMHSDSMDPKTPQTKPSTADWQAAHRFYTRAIQIFPDSGKPYGQLAILASYANDDLDALYWYTLSLGAKCPSVIVRDNLKVFFSRYQNRFKDLLSTIYPLMDNFHEASSTDEEEDTLNLSGYGLAQQQALARCDIGVLFIKIQMDLFAPHLESATFQDPIIQSSLCAKVAAILASEAGFESTVQKMVASMILIIFDLHARTSLSSFGAESTTKEGAMAGKQAQRAGLTYLLSIATVVLDRQLALLSQENPQQLHRSLNQDLLLPIELLIEFWISHWDQVWGMIRLEEKWVGVSNRSDMSLRKATVVFFRSFVNLLNQVMPQNQDLLGSESISKRALCLLQQDRGPYFGLLPFRRFHSQLAVSFDVVEAAKQTRLDRLLLFADKVIQASEGIRGTVVELSLELLNDQDQTETEVLQYRLLDAEDKRLLRERGSKMLASRWLQEQVSSLQKGLEGSERKGAHTNNPQGRSQQHSRRDSTYSRPLVPISTLPGTVKLPLSGQTRLTDHYQRSAPKFVIPGAPQQGRSERHQPQQQQQQTHKGRPDMHSPPYWTCVVDFSVLVWHLAEIKTLLEYRRCLIIVPLDVIDRLDQAKKGHDKENQKTREAIRFLDERLNIVRWGMSESLLVGQNVKDSLGRWSEAVPFLIEEVKEEGASVARNSTEEHIMTDAADEEAEAQPQADADADLSEVRSAGADSAEADQDSDVVMSETQSLTDPESTSVQPFQASHIKAVPTAATMNLDQHVVKHQDVSSGHEQEDDDEEEVEVRNVMNVPRVWRPILGACLFMLRKREPAYRVPENRFILLTEDQDLEHYAAWFNIPTSTIHAWKHNGL